MKQVLSSLRNYYVTDKKNMIRTLLITEGFGFCFSLSCVLGVCLDKRDTVCQSLGMIIGNLMLAIILGQIVTFILMLVFGLPRDTRLHDGSNADVANEPAPTQRTLTVRILQWIVVSIVLILLWLPIFAAYYPAVFSYDAEMQLYQVISRNYSTHHPLIHTLIMGGFMKAGFNESGIGDGMAAYAITQSVLMAFMIGAALTTPWKKRRILGQTRIILLTAFYGVFPVFGILMISTTKDILFAGFVLIFSMLLVDSYDSHLQFVAIGIFGTLMMLFRNNAMYAMVVMLVLTFICSFEKLKGISAYGRRITITILLSIIVSAGILGGLKNLLNAEAGSPREALAIPIQQMARVKVLHADEISGELRDNLSSLIDDEWADRYDEHLADPIKERISMKQPGNFIRTWIKLGLKYPADYIDAWLLTTEGAWYVRDTSCNRIYGEGRLTGFGYLSTDIRNMPEGFEVRRESMLPGLLDILESIVSDNSFEKIPVIRLIFSPALYFWLLMLYAYRCLISRNKRAILPALFLMVYFLTLMMSPAILVRYMLPYMLVSPILLGLKNDRS